MKWLKRHSLAVNLVLAFLSALCAGLWTNLVTAGGSQEARVHLLLAVAVAMLVVQVFYNRWIEQIRKDVVWCVRHLVLHFIKEHAKPTPSDKDLRVLIHLKEQAKPGPKIARQECLVPRLNPISDVIRDNGAIPIHLPSFKEWYVILQALHGQRCRAGEPDPARRPPADGYYIDSPSLFNARSVISVPIWRQGAAAEVMGTLTVDSTLPIADLRWKNGAEVDADVYSYLEHAARLISRILWDEDENC